MHDITVRRLRFEFDSKLDPGANELQRLLACSSIALSFTLPYLEPYLIRTMRAAISEVGDPDLIADMRHFSQQEGHHYRNHAVYNEHIRAQLSPATAAGMRRLEDALEADYRRFSKHKSLRWNVAYAEGFEAMTCAMALTTVDTGLFGAMGAEGELFEWHLAEEIEHRTVAFDVFRHVVGSYAYRMLYGTYAQIHYQRYLDRFFRCLMEGFGETKRLPRVSPLLMVSWRRYLRTFSPWYDPAKLEVPKRVTECLSKYTALAEADGRDPGARASSPP